LAHLSPSAPARKLKFTGSDRFIRELRRRVDVYFEETGLRPRDCPQMYLKTAIVLTWFFGSYVLLLFAATSLWTVVPLTIMLGLGLAAIGFNIQHDGGHKAYSSRPWVNRVMAKTMDMVGASSYIWAWKHNTFHHTYPNIDGHDDDIDLGFLARMSPHQKRLRFHRAQGVYLWFLYGFITLKWHLFDDFYDVIRGRIGDHKIPRPQGKALFTFIVGKALFFSMVFLIPMLLHPWWAVLLVYVTAAFINGVIVSIVFQLAHCVEEADFPAPATTCSARSATCTTRRCPRLSRKSARNLAFSIPATDRSGQRSSPTPSGSPRWAGLFTQRKTTRRQFLRPWPSVLLFVVDSRV
jgi:linoleoyl-CoA desaturase